MAWFANEGIETKLDKERMLGMRGDSGKRVEGRLW